jgi:glycosyltransferase involved in cell wall biosynthesis
MPVLLQINAVANTGSTGRIAEEIGKLALQQGWSSYLAYGRKAESSQLQLIRVGGKLSVLLHVLVTRLFDRHGFGSKYATRRLIKTVRRIKPDVIHLHNLHGYYLNVRALFRFLSSAGIPVVWTLHDCWPLTGRCTHFACAACSKWTTACCRCPQKGRYPKSLFLDRSKSSYRQKRQLFTGVKGMTVVPVSRWLGEVVGQSFLRGSPVRVILNGIDTDAFSPQPVRAGAAKKYGLEEGKLVALGVAGTWSDRKGLNDFAELNKMLDHSRQQIALVGLSKRQIKNLPEGIVGIERTENVRELAELYSIAAVFLNPTWEDTFPTTNLEALACGTPVVTYRTGGSVEAVSEDTGAVVEQGDVEGLYRALQAVQEKGKAFYAPRCRQRALSLYDRQDRFKEYMALYDQLLRQQ